MYKITCGARQRYHVGWMGLASRTLITRQRLAIYNA
jgi:hypothetical protein